VKEDASDFLKVPPLAELLVSPNAVDTTEVVDCFMLSAGHEDVWASPKPSPSFLSNPVL